MTIWLLSQMYRSESAPIVISCRGSGWTGSLGYSLGAPIANRHWRLALNANEILIYSFYQPRPLGALTDWLDN